jgi:hypothetical protein
VSNSEFVAGKLEAIPTVGTLTATYISTNTDGTVQVDFGGGPVTIYSAGLSTPLPGVGVRVIRLNGFTLMLGVVKPQPAFGVVVATGTPTLTVELPDGTTSQIPYLTSYVSPAMNDVVLISWPDGPVIVGKLAAAPTSDYIPPTGGGSGATQVMEFVADDSGNFYIPGGSWNYNDPWASSQNTGAFFHSAIAGSIPDSANVSLVELYVTEFYSMFPNVQSSVGLHSLTSKSGNPNVRSATPISAGSGWKTLPNSFGDALKTGAATSLGFASVPSATSYRKFRGRGSGAQEGKIRITFTN